MKKFALIGIAGFVAKKHINCIKKLDGQLVATLDKHDNVGFIDNMFPDCKFFKNENLFFKFVKKNFIDYVVICSPSYLHYKHIRNTLISKSNAIVEKPPVLNFQSYLKIQKLENITKKKCYCIFQLRLDKNLIKLKKDKSLKYKKNKVLINYYTFRGDWYFKSWKNNKKESGGLLINIAIHFFDILNWIFNDFTKIKYQTKTQSNAKGIVEFKNAKINWFVSVNKLQRYKDTKLKYHRIMKINDKVINFNKFNDLHLENYKQILNGKFHISEFENTIKFLNLLK